MLRMVTAAFLSLFVAMASVPASAEVEEVTAAEVAGTTTLTAKEAGELLSKAVVQLQRVSTFTSSGPKGGVTKTETQTFCSAAKVGERQFLSAGHCANSAIGGRVTAPNGFDWVGIRSLTVTTQEKADGERDEDWMILNTVGDLEGTVALELGCDDEIYLGMPVAYAGYPVPVDFGMGLGHVVSLNKVKTKYNNLDFVIDVAAAPGASGSPVISLDTGHVIGVLTEGVFSRRVGVFGIGIEHIAGLDFCEDYLAEKDKKEEESKAVDASVLSETDKLASPF